MGYSNGYDDGDYFGQKAGFKKGYAKAKAEFGRPDAEVRQEAYAEGKAAGVTEGKAIGKAEGVAEGYTTGFSEATNGTLELYTYNSYSATSYSYTMNGCSLGGKNVTGLQYCQILSFVELPVAETTIGYNEGATGAFEGDHHLYGATMLKLKTIGRCTFKDCFTFTCLHTSPGSIEDIGNSAFLNCYYMDPDSGLSLFKNVKSIGSCAFECYDTSYEDEGYSPESYKNIVKTSWPNVSFPALEHIGYDAFSGRVGMQTASFPALETLTDKHGYEAGWIFYGCSDLSSVSMPNLKAVSSGNVDMFSGCTSLTSIDFSSLTSETVLANVEKLAIPSGCTVTCSDGTITIQ